LTGFSKLGSIHRMHHARIRRPFDLYVVFLSAILAWLPSVSTAAEEPRERHLLYVATPGIRNELKYGGHGVLVFDIEAGHQFVRRVPSAGFAENGQPDNLKGICASASLQRLYVSTIGKLISFDLTTNAIVWEKKYGGGCDRMAIFPDGKTLYQPSFERDHWHVLDAATGDVVARVEPNLGAHNTNYGADGKETYLAGLHSPTLAVADTSPHKIVRRVDHSAR